MDVPALPEPPATHRGGPAPTPLSPGTPPTPERLRVGGQPVPSPLTHRVPSALDSRRNQSLSARLLFSTYYGGSGGERGRPEPADRGNRGEPGGTGGTGREAGKPRGPGAAGPHLDEGAVLLLQPRRPALPVPRPRRRSQQRQLRHRPPRRLVSHAHRDPPILAGGGSDAWRLTEPSAAILLRGVTHRGGGEPSLLGARGGRDAVSTPPSLVRAELSLSGLSPYHVPPPPKKTGTQWRLQRFIVAGWALRASPRPCPDPAGK